MPVITFDGPKLSREQKKFFIEKFTEIAQEATKIPREAFIVIVREFGDECMGLGGQTVEEIKKNMGRS